MSVLFHAGQMLTTHARLRPSAPAVHDLDRTLTFSDWNTRACRLANALSALGLAKGDRVAILAYNRLEWAEIYCAAAKSGIVIVPINFRLTAPETAFIISDAGASALIYEDALSDTVEAARADLSIPENSYIRLGEPYEDLLAHASSDEPAAEVHPDDQWCLLYTSGTTGSPKGAIRNHRGMAMMALMTEVEFRLHRRDHALLVMPMCHANSLNFFTAFLYCGAQITIFSRASFDAGLCLRTLGQGITFSSLVPTHYTMLLDVPRPSSMATVEKLLVSSATAFVETKQAILEMFPNSGLYELYGSTEAGWVTMLHPEEQFDHLGTVGRETVGSAPIKLLDDDGHEVPDGEPGELFSCSPYQFSGYWNLPDKTAEAFRGDYLSVGDVALRDADGFIKLIDRKKNLIVSGGENIYPSEVEAVLSGHPGIREIAVIGVPDPKWSERVVACIVPTPGEAIDAAVLMDWARDKLAGYKRPREIHFLTADEMPRNATGKILHRRLRDRFTQ